MMRKLVLMVILILMCGPVFAQSMSTAWVARYNGPANDNDKATALAVDDAGNVYVTGYSTGSDMHWDYLTIKYLPNGDTAWTRRYQFAGSSDDVGKAIAVDISGNVFVTGWSSDSGTGVDWATVKYDPSGNELWTRRFNGTYNGEDFPTAIAVDESGNVCVTGQGFYQDSDRDYTTIKYGPDGDTLWMARYDGPVDGYDYSTCMAMDDSGYIYVSGQSMGDGTGFDYATVKYRPDGDTVWVRRYTALGNQWDAATAIAVDPQGNVYVTGESYLDSTDKDYLTIRYYPNGDTAWTGRYNGPADIADKPYDIVIDAGGRVCVTGAQRTSSG
jgi:hypothetical protein